MRLFDVGYDLTDTDQWFTPPSVFAALGLRFDLDPASPPGGVPWIPADRYYTESDDGLTQPWNGLVWLNPPYSAPAPWIERLYQHGQGVALLPGDTGTAWFHDYVAPGDAHCFVRGRLAFVAGNGPEATNARTASIIVAYGSVAADAVRRCGLGWIP